MWSKKQFSEELSVGEYAVWKAWERLKEKGIIALPDPIKGESLDQGTVDLIKHFYQNHEYYRTMPGKKDKSSISKNIYEQKRLLLGNSMNSMLLSNLSILV